MGPVARSVGSLRQIRTNQSDWCDYSGPIGGKHGGILLMNDPQNFRKPWWHAVDTGLLIANPLGESELNGRGKKRENVLVEKGKPFRLRYGALIHLHDEANDFDPKKAYQAFRKILAKPASSKVSDARSDLLKVPEDNDNEIRIVRMDAQTETMSQQLVASRKRTHLSAMPGNFSLLGNEQVSYLVAFLSQCREGVPTPGGSK